MLTNISSLIQLFAAIYLTMCLDNLFFNRFWARDYSEIIEKEFKKIKHVPDEALKPSINRVKDAAEDEEKRMRRLGTFMFIMTSFLLIFIGFENGIIAYTGSQGLAYSYVFLSVMMLLFYGFDRYLMDRWLKVYGVIIVLLLVFCGLVFLLPSLRFYDSFRDEFSHFWRVAAKTSVVVAIIIPVMWQLFRNWVYARFYLSHILAQVEAEVGKFNNAISFDSEKQSIHSIKASYQDLAVKVATSRGTDARITDLSDGFMAELSLLDYSPTLIPLLKNSWALFRFERPSLRRRKKLYKGFIELKSSMERMEYCRNNNVSYKAMFEYYQKKEKRSELDQKGYVNRIAIIVLILASVIVVVLGFIFRRKIAILSFSEKAELIMIVFLIVAAMVFLTYALGPFAWRSFKEKHQDQGSAKSN